MVERREQILFKFFFLLRMNNQFQILNVRKQRVSREGVSKRKFIERIEKNKNFFFL